MTVGDFTNTNITDEWRILMKLWYLPLEPYESRYTFQLLEWNIRRFNQRNIAYEVIHGQTIDDSKEIKVGQVLDAHGRSFYSLTQTAVLVQKLRDGDIQSDDVIFTEDMFHPGFESIFYILEQIPENKRPKVYTRCLAQTLDPDDFVHEWDWMRSYEQMVFKGLSKFGGIMMANTEFGVHAQIAKMDKECPIYITGLPFDMFEVRERVEHIKPLGERTMRVAYASRWDREKQPDFFMDLIEQWHIRHPEVKVEFAILNGSKELRSTDQKYLDRAHEMEAAGKLKIYNGLTKNEYYSLLADSRVMFNCARQDWWSNTVNEASTLGTLQLYPAYRSFPETLDNHKDFLYTPWSLDDAERKLSDLLSLNNHPDVYAVAERAHQTIDKTIDVLIGNGAKHQYHSENAYYKRKY